MGTERFRSVADLQAHASSGAEAEHNSEEDLECPDRTEQDKAYMPEQVAEEVERLISIASRLQSRKGMHVECGNVRGRFVGGHAPSLTEQGCMFFVICCCEKCSEKPLTYSEYDGRLMTVEQFHEHGTGSEPTPGDQAWQTSIKVVHSSGDSASDRKDFATWQKERSKQMFDVISARRRKMWIYWPGEDRWFLSRLPEYDEATGLCKVMYEEDGAVEHVSPAGELIADKPKDSTLGLNLDAICSIPPNVVRQSNVPRAGSKRQRSEPRKDSMSSRQVIPSWSVGKRSRGSQDSYATMVDSPMLAAANLLHNWRQDGDGPDSSRDGALATKATPSPQGGQPRGILKHPRSVSHTTRVFPDSSLLSDLEPGSGDDPETCNTRLLSVCTALRMQERLKELTDTAKAKRLLTAAEVLKFVLWWIGLESTHRLLFFRTVEEAAEKDSELVRVAQLIRAALATG